MKFYVIGDTETVLGFRLVGVEGRVVTDRVSALAALNDCVAAKNAGVVLITEKTAALIRDEVDAHLYGSGLPLVLEIPDSAGPSPERINVDEVVLRAVGVAI